SHLRYALSKGVLSKIRSESRRGGAIRRVARGSRAARIRGGGLPVRLGVENGRGDCLPRDLRLDRRGERAALAHAPRRGGPRHEHDVSSTGVRGGARAGAVRGRAGLDDGPRHGRGVRRRRDDGLESALAIVYFVALNALGHLGFVGSRMTTALFALQLGASPFTVGTLMSLFALLPMLLSVSSGRLIDRIGPRQPLAAAFAALAIGGVLPSVFPFLGILFLSSTLLGLGFMCVHIGMNSVSGAHGAPELRRTFIGSGVLAMGWDLYSFLMPLYGARLGLAAATIGSIMASFALATFVVRLAMPVLIRRVRQWRVLTASMAIAGLSYLL